MSPLMGSYESPSSASYQALKTTTTGCCNAVALPTVCDWTVALTSCCDPAGLLIVGDPTVNPTGCCHPVALPTVYDWTVT